MIHEELKADNLIDLAIKLVNEPSQQTDLLEYDPEVKSFISDFLVNELKSRGLENIQLDDMGNLICRIGDMESERKVFFLGYAMTHPASSMEDPFTGTLATMEGKQVVRGRGISEQKGSLAAMISAVEYVNNHRDELNGELVFAVSLAGETGRHDSVDSIRKAIDLKADFGVVGIGTNSKICQGNKGRVDILINIYGKSCHSSTPANGINAIEGASLVIEKLKGLNIEGEHPRLGKATLTPTSIKSFPDATHTIQNECRLVFDRRLLPGDSVEEAMKDVQEAIGDLSPFKVEVLKGPVTFPSEVPDDSIVIGNLSSSITETTKKEAGIFYSNGAIDAGYLNEYNIPSVMFGPGDMDFWHTDNEVLTIDDLVNGARTYATLAMNHLNKQ